jgi:hypothetical protein
MMANQTGTLVDQSVDGRYIVRRASDKGLIGTVNTDREVREILKDLIDTNVRNLDEGSPFPTRIEVTGSNPTRIQDQLTGTRFGLKVAQLGPFAVITPIKQIAQNIEAIKGFPAFTKIYEPLQSARQTINQLLIKGREAFGVKKITGGRTIFNSFEDAEKALSKKLSNLDSEQQRLSTLYAEAFTKEELERPGVLLARGMNQDEIDISRIFSSMGLAEQIPTLIRRNIMADDFLLNRRRMLSEIIPSMRNAIFEGKLPRELSADLDRLVASAGNEVNIVDVLHSMGATDNEVVASGMLRLFVDRGEDAYNIPAIIRHATAPKLEAGFKNGREQFVAKRGLNPLAQSAAEDRIKIIRHAFQGSGFDADQVVFAQLPIFRHLIDNGIWPGKQWGELSTVSGNKAARILDGFAEGSSVLTRRVLSGHINPHELDPIATTVKHVRNMLFREHFDPLMPGIKQQLKSLDSIDDRLGKMMGEYVHEIEGLPTEGFKRLNAVVRTMARFAGINVDERVAEKFVNTLVRISSQATIPFRVGIVARNAMQSPFFTMPVIGGEAWHHGLKVALGVDQVGGNLVFDVVRHRQAIERAIKAGAIDPNVLPIHASSEIFGAESRSILGSFGPKFAKGKLTVQEWFDMGFSFYRSPDDLGRVVAFEGQRFRFFKHLDDFQKGQIDLDEFKSRAKINTYDEVIVARADDLMRQERWEDAANYLGKQLADKTHLLYANANHPPGWGGVYGRLFGQFGTFPVQYLNYLTEGLTKNIGTKDWFEFTAVHSALNMGVVYGGAKVFGADLGSWATFGSLQYTGGPYAEAAMSLVQMWGGSDAEKALARRNLQMMFPTFDHPQSVFVPGSYFIGDFVDAFQADDLSKAALEAAGIRILKPGQKNWIDKAFGWVGEIGR